MDYLTRAADKLNFNLKLTPIGFIFPSSSDYRRYGMLIFVPLLLLNDSFTVKTCQALVELEMEK